MTTTRPQSRWLTANNVTIARILLLPFPCWALIARPDHRWMWAAFVFGTLVGATDFVDGWMARRDGATVLGSLLDPVADKLFVAMLLLPLVAHAECPGWAAGALFVRELLITSLRTSLSVRETALKTSQLGKLKTVVQMGGLACFFLCVFAPRDIMPYIHLFCATVMLILCGVFAWRKRGLPPVWLLGGTPLWFLVFGMAMTLEPNEVAFWVFMLMVAFTWISGADYLLGAAKVFRAEGPSRADLVRTAWSLVHGLALLPLIADHPGIVVPVIGILCCELALGGIDNIVAAQKLRFAHTTFWPTTLCALLISAAGNLELISASWLAVATWGLFALSLANLLVTFARERAVFLAPDRAL